MSFLGRMTRFAVESALGNRRVSQLVMSELVSRGYFMHRRFDDHQLVFNPVETVGRRIFEHGHFLRDVTDGICGAASDLHPEGVMIDIGANCGTQTVYAYVGGYFSRIIAVEPDPLNYQLLCTNVAMNARGTSVETHQIAFSDRHGVACMRLDPYNSGASTIELDPKRGTRRPPSHVQVETVRGATLLSDLGVSADDISLIWMDVERHEAAALEGLSEILQARPALYFEYFYDQPSDERVETIDSLVFSSYPNLYVEDVTLSPVTREQLLSDTGSKCGHVNILATAHPVSIDRFNAIVAAYR